MLLQEQQLHCRVLSDAMQPLGYDLTSARLLTFAGMKSWGDIQALAGLGQDNDCGEFR